MYNVALKNMSFLKFEMLVEEILSTPSLMDNIAKTKKRQHQWHTTGAWCQINHPSQLSVHAHLVRSDNQLGQELVRQRVEVIAIKLGLLAGAEIRLCGSDQYLFKSQLWMVTYHA